MHRALVSSSYDLAPHAGPREHLLEAALGAGEFGHVGGHAGDGLHPPGHEVARSRGQEVRRSGGHEVARSQDDGDELIDRDDNGHRHQHRHEEGVGHV